MYLLTDFFPGGELLALHQAAGKFTTEEARFYVASIVVMFE